MRKISFKRYQRDTFEIIAHQVPTRFDIAYRYLRKLELAKFVHDYSPEYHGWGWYMEIGDTLRLAYLNPMAVINEPTVVLEGAFNTPRQRRQTLMFVVAQLTLWRNNKFGDPLLSQRIEKLGKFIWESNPRLVKMYHKELDTVVQIAPNWVDLPSKERKECLDKAKALLGEIG